MLGPPDGRYLLRDPDDRPDAPPSHVLVIATLGAPERHRLSPRRERAKAEREPEPSLARIGRATVIDVGEPLRGSDQARGWLSGAGEADLRTGLAVLDRAVYAFRLVVADPYLPPVARHHLLVARLGYGAGEQVAEGSWTEAIEIIPRPARRRRVKVLQPQARFAAILGGRERVLACEELTLRARLDLDQSRLPEAALQLLVALDAALAELERDPGAPLLQDRLAELRAQRDRVAAAGQAALCGQLTVGDRDVVAFTLGRIEAVLRARALAGA